MDTWKKSLNIKNIYEEFLNMSYPIPKVGK